MKSFPLFGLLATAAGTLLIMSTVAVADDPPKHHEHFMACAKACAACQLECDSCFAHCKHLVGEGKKEHATSVQTCVDCSEFCSLAAKLAARHSPFAIAACEGCAKACDGCAAECEKFKDDEHMARCAKECRACAKACREMLEHVKQ
jgi:hypothetical protein